MKAVREEEVKLRGGSICETGRFYKPEVEERGSYGMCRVVNQKRKK